MVAAMMIVLVVRFFCIGLLTLWIDSRSGL